MAGEKNEGKNRVTLRHLCKPLRWLAAGVLALPLTATAQVNGDAQHGEVMVQIASIGSDVSPATKVTLTALIMTRGATVAEARSANSILFDKVMVALRTAGAGTSGVRVIPPSRAIGFVGNEMYDPSVFDGGGAENSAAAPALAEARKPFVTNSIEVRLPQANLYEKVRDALEAAGAKSVSPPFYGLADDSAARRNAKANALARAQADARSYAEPLGLKVVRVVRIVESGVGGDLANWAVFASQMSAQFASTGDVDLGQVKTTQAISVEFALAPK